MVNAATVWTRRGHDSSQPVDYCRWRCPTSPRWRSRCCDASDVEAPVLTGGNDLAALGGYAPERDATENALLDAVESRGLPVLGVCRGMQLIQQRCAIPLRRVTGHVTTRQTIYIDGRDGGGQQLSSLRCPRITSAARGLGGRRRWCRQGDSPLGVIDHRNHVASRTKYALRATEVALFRRVFELA